MSEIYNRRIKNIKSELEHLSKSIDMLEGLDIEMDITDMPNDLLYTIQKLLSHTRSEIEDIYHILYRIRLEQKNKGHLNSVITKED